MDKPEFTNMKGMDIIINAGFMKCRLGNIYRPPLSADNGHQDFGVLLEDYISYHGKMILFGDFNFHVDDKNDHAATRFMSLLQDSELHQHAVGSTDENGHTLDLIISRPSDHLVINTVTSTIMTDHNWVHFTIDQAKPSWSKKQISFRKLRNIDHDQLKIDLFMSSLSAQNHVDTMDTLADDY